MTWNIRDKHFHEIVKDLVAHLQRHYTPRPRIVVWAHNSHLGDASATDMARPGAPCHVYHVDGKRSSSRFVQHMICASAQ